VLQGRCEMPVIGSFTGIYLTGVVAVACTTLRVFEVDPALVGQVTNWICKPGSTSLGS